MGGGHRARPSWRLLAAGALAVVFALECGAPASAAGKAWDFVGGIAVQDGCLYSLGEVGAGAFGSESQWEWLANNTGQSTPDSPQCDTSGQSLDSYAYDGSPTQATGPLGSGDSDPMYTGVQAPPSGQVEFDATSGLMGPGPGGGDDHTNGGCVWVDFSPAWLAVVPPTTLLMDGTNLYAGPAVGLVLRDGSLYWAVLTDSLGGGNNWEGQVFGEMEQHSTFTKIATPVANAWNEVCWAAMTGDDITADVLYDQGQAGDTYGWQSGNGMGGHGGFMVWWNGGPTNVTPEACGACTLDGPLTNWDADNVILFDDYGSEMWGLDTSDWAGVFGMMAGESGGLAEWEQTEASNPDSIGSIRGGDMSGNGCPNLVTPPTYPVCDQYDLWSWGGAMWQAAQALGAAGLNGSGGSASSGPGEQAGGGSAGSCSPLSHEGGKPCIGSVVPSNPGCTGFDVGVDLLADAEWGVCEVGNGIDGMINAVIWLGNAVIDLVCPGSAWDVPVVGGSGVLLGSYQTYPGLMAEAAPKVPFQWIGSTTSAMSATFSAPVGTDTVAVAVPQLGTVSVDLDSVFAVNNTPLPLGGVSPYAIETASLWLWFAVRCYYAARSYFHPGGTAPDI